MKPTGAGSEEGFQWNATIHGDYLWSNVNFGEAITQIMTPMTSSVLLYSLKDWSFYPGIPTVGNIAGFPYLNISIFASLYNSIGKTQKDLMDNLGGTLYMRLPDGMPIPTIPMSLMMSAQGIWKALGIQLRQRSGINNLSNYIQHNPARFGEIRQQLQDLQSSQDLMQLWNKTLSPHLLEGVWTVLGAATYSADYTHKIQRKISGFVGKEDAIKLIASLSTDTEALSSLAPILGLQRIARGEMTQERYLELYGHRGPNEFELSEPRPAEDPSWLAQELDQYQALPIQVETLIRKQHQQYEAAWSRLINRLPRRRGKFKRWLAENARRARLREQARSEYVRDRWLIRLFVLRAAELIELGEEVFFLTIEELLDQLSGGIQESSRMKERQQIYQSLGEMPPPPPVIRGRFDPFSWGQQRQDTLGYFDASHREPDPFDGVVSGAAASAGRAEGHVRRLDHPQQGTSLAPGEILVTSRTDISWTPIFLRAAAVVTDIGAPLSHAAIVARELGIPAVVGCGNATRVLKTGDRVLVDGSAGQVKILQD